MSLVILPNGETKQSKQILKDIVICSDNTQYYWNEFSEDIIKATYSVNSVPPFVVPETNCGIVNKISYILSGVEYESNNFGKIYPTGGSGINLCVEVDTKQVTKYILDSYTINNSGIDYKINDIVYSDILGSLVVTSANSIQKNQIKNYTIEYDTNFHDTKFQENILASSNNGSPSSFKISYIENPMYEIDSINIISSGKNYETGDVISIDGIGSFSLNVDYGIKNITSFDIISLPTTHYSQLSPYVNNLPSYNKSGSGTGATFKADYKEQWNVKSCKLKNGGSGYKVGDYLYVSNYMTNYAYATVTEVSKGTNNILSFHTDNEVVGVTNKITNFLIHADGGTGHGASFYINSSIMDSYTLDTVTINSEGIGYSIGDTITLSSNPNVIITVDTVYDKGSVLKYTETLSTTELTTKPPSIIETTTNGLGTGYTCSLTYDIQDYYILTNTQLLDGGSGFIVGNSYDFAQGSITVNTVYTGGEILSYTKTISTNWFYGSSGTQNIAVNSATGSGAIATVSISTNKSDIVYYPTFSISNSGSNYSRNDIIEVYDENNINLGFITVINVGSNGNISEISYTAYRVSQSIKLSYTYVGLLQKDGSYIKTGANATFSASFVTTKNYFKIVDISISNVGSGYALDDVLEVGLYGSITVTKIANAGQIHDYTFVSNVPDNNISNPSSSSISNGTSVATIKLIWSETFKYLVSGITDVTIGKNYKVGDKIIIGNYATLIVSNVTNGGEIKTIKYIDNEKYYSQDKSKSNVLGISTSNGTGASFDLEYSSIKINAITSIELNDSGYGYSVGDVLTLGEYGKIVVDTVNSGIQEILSCSITYVDDYFDWYFGGEFSGYGGEGVTGTGATFDVTSNQSYVYTNLEISNSGSNYNVNDILDVDGDTYSDNNYYSDGGIVKITGIQKNSQPVSGITNIKSYIIQNPIYDNITCSGGSGSGLVVSISYKKIPAYKITDIKLLNSGNNYSVGDKLDLNGYGTATVTEVSDGGGNVLELSQSIKTIDSDKPTDESGTYELSGGSGSGLSISISYKEETYYEISNIKLINGGYGYSNGDYLKLDNFQGISITSVINKI